MGRSTDLQRFPKVAFVILMLLIVAACNSYDKDYIPYTLKGFDVWVYDNATDKEYYGGRVKANYFSKDSALSRCRDQAYTVAKQYKLTNWSYVCCTVTGSSDCVTKVR